MTFCLNLLPEDIILNIFKRTSNPQNFARVSQDFRTLSKEPRFKAHWFVHHYGPRFALYYAILRMPQSCTDTLVSTLVNCGAIIPRYLVQMLVQFYHGPRRFLAEGDDKIPPLQFASSKLPFTGYAYIVNHAWSRYGDIWGAGRSDDLMLFIKYAGYRSREHRNIDRLNDLIHTYSFIPLPLPDTGVMRNIIHLASEYPDIFCHFADMFLFDRSVRMHTWKIALLYLLDYTQTPRDPERRVFIVRGLNRCFGDGKPPPFDDKAVFKTAFAVTFVHVLERQTDWHVLVNVLKQVEEDIRLTFSVEEAAREMLEARDQRKDLCAALVEFLGFDMEEVEKTGAALNGGRHNWIWR